jgi:hypothetical protein
MRQAQAARLQRLAVEEGLQVRLAVHGVADQAVAERLHVHADLVGAAGFEAALHQADRTAVELALRPAARSA